MQGIINAVKWLEVILFALSVIGLSVNFLAVKAKIKPGVAGKRTVVRFSKGTIWLHWLHTVSFIFLLATGTILLFGPAGMEGRGELVLVHLAAVLLFAGLPLVYALTDLKRAGAFIGDAFRWGKDDIAWLKAAPAYYFTANEVMPPQKRINAGQKLWQLTVIVTGVVFLPTGIMLWIFQGQAGNVVILWPRLLHILAFTAVSVMFNVHLYMSLLHPKFGESLNSMLDGKVSEAYAREHYPLWYEKVKQRKPVKAAVPGEEKTTAGVH